MTHEQKYYALPYKLAMEGRLQNGNRIKIYRCHNGDFRFEFQKKDDCKIKSFDLSKEGALALAAGINQVWRAS